MALEVSNRRLLSLFSLLAAVFLGASSVLVGTCGPFTDVGADSFCPFVLEIFTLGITAGTTPTTYDPASNVTRLQMAAFLSRSVDGVLKRGSRRAAARKFYTPQNVSVVGVTTFSGDALRFDGADLWVSNASGGTVGRVRASDGRLLETWTGASGAVGVAVAMGRIVLCGSSPGRLFVIDPRQPAGVVATVVSTLPNDPTGIDFDGARFWTANTFGSSVSIITPGATIPWSSTNVNITVGSSAPTGVVFDGTNIWVSDANANTIVKLDPSGGILQTVTVGGAPYYPVFDGTNIWVPNHGGASVTVLRAASGTILQTLTGNGLNFPNSAAFDGERILVTNKAGDSVSLWKAADLTPLGTFGVSAGSFPQGATSDGLNFWIVTETNLARF